MIRRSCISLRSCLAFSFSLISPQPDNFALEKHDVESQAAQHAAYDTIVTEHQYWALLKDADELTFQREFETEFLLLLSPKEKTAYAALPSLDRRKAFIEFYWKSRNPNPLLPENDRLLDHLRRRVYARQEFVAAKPPYFDDRGKYLVKYGKPLHRVRDVGGQRRLQESSVTIAFNFYSVMENESWSYVNIAPNFVVHFARDGESFKEIKSLKEVIIGNHRRGLLAWYWSDLLKRRFWMSPAINDAVTQIQASELELRVRNRGQPVRVDNLGTPGLRVVNQIFKNLEKADDETDRASLGVPPAAYQAVHAINKLAFSDVVSQFRGPDGQTRVEITLLSPLKNYVAHFDSLSTDTARIEFSALLRDQRFDSLAGARQQRKFPAKLAAAENLPLGIGYLTILTAPQQAELSLQVKDEINEKLGFSQRPLVIRDFSGDRLMMSDLQFFVNVTNANQRQTLPTLVRESVAVAPYPYEEIRPTLPLPLYCYFEVYNLQTAGLENEYTITYKVFQDKSRQSAVKKLFGGGKEVAISITSTRPITGDTANELIALDLGNLAEGAYRLEVAIADGKDKNISISAQKDFVITE